MLDFYRCYQSPEKYTAIHGIYTERLQNGTTNLILDTLSTDPTMRAQGFLNGHRMKTSDSHVMHLQEGSTHLVKCMAPLAHKPSMGFAWIKQIGQNTSKTLWTVDIGYSDDDVRTNPSLQLVDCE